jgi:serine/threonine-protein kinase HipA
MFDIYLYDTHVGTLTPRGRGVRFAYARDALADDRLPALSVSLPKRTEPYRDSEAGPFFRNLLPEQAYRRLIATAVGTAPENSVALLGAVGGECPGAVSIWPEGTAPPPVPEYAPVDVTGLQALFSPGDPQRLANAVRRGRLSLAGVQEKIALFRDPVGQWFLPLNGAITSHILKEATREFPHILENELFCLTLATQCGLNVPPTELVAPTLRILCTERFDRPPAPPHAKLPRRKLHQEDFCQVLTVEPERKYEADGGPGLKQCAAAIRRYSSLPADDLTRLVRWVGFNYLIGNEDAHAKNLAFLYLPEELRLTPHYDLVSTEVYPGLERRLAMKLGRSWDIRSVQRTDWRAMAAGVDMPWDQVHTNLLALTAAMQAALPQAVATSRTAFGESLVYQQIVDVIARHMVHLERTAGVR